MAEIEAREAPATLWWTCGVCTFRQRYYCWSELVNVLIIDQRWVSIFCVNCRAPALLSSLNDQVEHDHRRCVASPFAASG